MTTRQEKVNSLLQQEIASYILSEGLEGLSGILTITKVDVTADLEHAKVYFSVIGQDENETQEILKKNVYTIQGRLNRRLEMRKVPRISFFPDRSGQYAEHIAKLLRNVKKEDRDEGEF